MMQDAPDESKVQRVCEDGGTQNLEQSLDITCEPSF